jgi:hypothetical protein
MDSANPADNAAPGDQASAAGGLAGDGSLSWRVRPGLPAAKLLGAAALAGLGYVFGRHEPLQWLAPAAVVLWLGGWAARDLLFPVRLAADPAGLTLLVGFGGRQRLPWATIEQVRVDRRERRGLRSELLEIDAGSSLRLLSRNDLGAEPDEVAAALNALRASARGEEPGYPGEGPGRPGEGPG